MKNTFALIIFLSAIFGIQAQTQCDTNRQIFIFLEHPHHPPKMNISEDDLEIFLNTNVSKTDEKLKDVEFIYLMYYINCRGEDYKYQIALFKNGKTNVDSTSSFSHSLTKLLKSKLEFTPAYLEYISPNKTLRDSVDFQGAKTIQFKENYFHVLNEKENKKHFKKKNKQNPTQSN
jgi:hypothetical protein